VAVRGMIVAKDRQHALDRDGPAHPWGTRINRLLLMDGPPPGPVWPMKMQILQRGSPAPDVHHLRPLMTYSSPRALNPRTDVGGVGRSDVGLAHREAGANFRRLTAASASALAAREFP